MEWACCDERGMCNTDPDPTDTVPPVLPLVAETDKVVELVEVGPDPAEEKAREVAWVERGVEGRFFRLGMARMRSKVFKFFQIAD